MSLVRLTGWLRPVAMLLALTGTLALTACGGGGGAINGPTTPTTPTPTLTTLPAGIVVAYSQIAATIKIVGGVAPYVAVSNNSAVLPVPLNVPGDTLVLVANPVAIGTDVPVAITVTDQSGQTAIVNVVVRYAPLFESGVTVTPSSSNCGTNLCDGDTAGVLTVATGVGGAPLPGRQILFEVVYGAFSILTSNPALPATSRLTVVTDAAGAAQVQIQASAGATTQQAQIRATDVATGQQQIANFVIERKTSTNNLSVVPPTASIQTLYNNSCSTGFNVDYYIYGGTPPYTVASTFPTGVVISPSVVSSSGSFFRATTNGTCVNPLTFTIQDSAGKTTTATLINTPGTQNPPGTAAPTLVVTPSSVTSTACSGGTTQLFVVTGGTPPYNVNLPTLGTGSITTTTPTAPSSGSFIDVTVTGVTPPAAIPFTVVDSGTPTAQTRTVTITCNVPAP